MNPRFVLLLIFILAGVTANQCLSQIVKAKASLKTMFQAPQPQNLLIDGAAELAKGLVEVCGQYSKKSSKYINAICIDELYQAIKIINSLFQQYENQVKFAFDLSLLERFLQKQNKDCQFWQYFKTNQIKNKISCAKAVYDQFLLMEKGFSLNSKEHLLMIFDNLPDTLDQCGQDNLANILKEYATKECSSDLATLIHNAQTIEYNQLLAYYKQAVDTCTFLSLQSHEQIKQLPVKVSNGPTYDFVAPFKDYNFKITLSVQGLASGKSMSFTANFKQNNTWVDCFGSFSMKFDTTQVGNKYVTVITESTGKNLNLTKTCDISGTNSGQAQIFPGVTVPIVSAVTVDGVSLTMLRPCESTGCKDPLNGYTNAGYYAQWAVWGRQYNPYHIPFENINQIFYAFVGFNAADGSVKSLDSSADGWGMTALARAMLQYPYLRTHISFGGWTNAGVFCAPMFEQLASNQTSMDRFANQSVSLMRKLGFSGIDIDWEWWSSYKDEVAPAKKTLQFYKTLRKAIDQAGNQDGKTYRLSTAVNGGTSRILAMQNKSNPNGVPNFWEQCNVLLDQINIMNYDYHGAWDVGTPAYFQAPYDYQNVPDDIDIGKQEGWDIKSSVQTYIDNGIDAKKILIGLVLDGRTMQVTNATNGGLLQTVKGPGFGDYEQGMVDYKCIMNPVYNPATGCGSPQPVSVIQGLEFYDQTHNSDIWAIYGKDALQTWAFNPKTMAFITYQTVWSVSEKTKLVKSNKLMGTMFWELDGDMTDDRSLIMTAKKILTS